MRHKHIKKELTHYIHKRRAREIKEHEHIKKYWPDESISHKLINKTIEKTGSAGISADIKEKEVGSMNKTIEKRDLSELQEESDEQKPQAEQSMTEDAGNGSTKEGKSFLDRLKSIFSFTKKSKAGEAEDEYEEAGNSIESAVTESSGAQNIVIADEEVKKDLAASMKISLALMQKLSESELDRFKRSQDFQNYKELLVKYKIKKL